MQIRRTLNVVSLAGLTVLALTTAGALAGPHRLRGRIPIHFDLAGRPNGWGTPRLLLFLPIAAGVLYVLMTLVARYPASFNYPVRVTRANLDRLQLLAIQMIAWLKAEVIWLFVCIQIVAINTARSGKGNGIASWLMPAAMGVVFGTILGYVVAMRRSA